MTEPVVYSEAEVFYGFEGTYFNNEIQTLGVLVHDRICSGEVEAPEPEPEVVDPEPEEPEVVTPEPEEPEVVTPEPEEPVIVTPDPLPVVIDNPYKPECIVSKGNIVGDTALAPFGTPFSAKDQW